MFNEIEKFDVLSVVSLASFGSTVTGSGVDLNEYTGKGKFVCQAPAGNTGTLDVKIQHCATDTSGSYVDSGITFTQITTAASRQIQNVNLDSLHRWIRAVGTIGTGPQTFSLSLTAMKKVLG